MKNLSSRLPRFIRHPYFPLTLILIANLVTGLFTFQDYGLSWDEPLFYQYAEAVPYAYSISARLSGDFDIEKAYGPSAEDHKIYGPIYLLLAKPVVSLLDSVLPVPRAELWHLVNFLTSQIGLAFFFILCLRWMSPWAAFGATLLFSTQPVIWGHSWINPKDTPFTVFFLAALYFGLMMVDALSIPPDESSTPASADRAVSERRWHASRRILQILALFLIIITAVSFIFSNQIGDLLRELIHSAYTAAPGSLMGKIFGFLAANAETVPESAYVNKGLILLSRMKAISMILSILALIPALLLTVWMSTVQHTSNWIAERLAPLPVRPSWWWSRSASWQVILKILLAGILLGLVVSIRVIGPLVGVLVFLYFILKAGRHSFGGMVIYGVVALLALYFSWPYLWAAPLTRFVDVVQHMSRNPKILPVLFNSVVYASDKLPRTYLPEMLGITLTWPVWLMFISGLVVSWRKFKLKKIDWRSISLIIFWFLAPLGYVLAFRPPIYDGYRHFLFILPPVFILCGLVFQVFWEWLQNRWAYALVLVVLIMPGVIGIARLHPYEYTYYNELVGGTGGIYRQYETDFWLTCYKELMAQVDEQVPAGTTIFVHRQPSIVQEYAAPGINIARFDPDDDQTFSGSLLLLTTRANVDLSLHPEAPEIFNVGREGATFCLVKDIP